MKKLGQGVWSLGTLPYYIYIYIQGAARRDELRLQEAPLRDEEGQGGARVPNEDGKPPFYMKPI